jgi:hypothetical protein
MWGVTPGAPPFTPPRGYLSPGKYPGREGGAVIPPLWASLTPPFLIFWGNKIGIHFPAVSPGNVAANAKLRSVTAAQFSVWPVHTIVNSLLSVRSIFSTPVWLGMRG